MGKSRSSKTGKGTGHAAASRSGKAKDRAAEKLPAMGKSRSLKTGKGTGRATASRSDKVNDRAVEKFPQAELTGLPALVRS